MAKKPPFDFIIDELNDLNPRTKPMFGAFGVYVDSKIIFILYKKENNPLDCGVWLATTGEHHKSLQQDFPNMRSIDLFGPGPTGWQVLPEDSEDFEESIFKAIEFVRKGDLRIGKIPKTKIRKKQKTKTKASTKPMKSVKKRKHLRKK